MHIASFGRKIIDQTKNPFPGKISIERIFCLVNIYFFEQKIGETFLSQIL